MCFLMKQWFFYHNWGIPNTVDINNDGISDIIMQFKGLHNNAPDVNLLIFNKRKFMICGINAAIYELTEINKSTTTVSSLFREQDGEFLFDIELYGDERKIKSYYLKNDSLI
jgi:hypothetical protein